MIDLHSHTTSSDGQHAPEELLALAKAAGVRRLAVTDHDTVAGLARATAAGAAQGVEVVPGIEISAYVDRREVHMLGHFVDPSNAKLLAFCDRFRTERTRRMEKMVEKVSALGFQVTMAEVEAIAQGAQLCRPHLARALMARGYITSTKEAFERWLADGRPGFVDKDRLTAPDAIALIRQAGGTATLAHPGVSRMGRAEIEELARQGMSGLEVFHSDHNPSMREKMLAIATECGLIATAGSDFHGQAVAPGRVLGTASMDPKAFDALHERA